MYLKSSPFIFNTGFNLQTEKAVKIRYVPPLIHTTSSALLKANKNRSIYNKVVRIEFIINAILRKVKCFDIRR